MPLKYRPDSDLAILALASHDDLTRLANVLTVDVKDGEKRYTQQLLNDPSYQQAFKEQNLTGAWRSIAAELQAYGGDSFVNAMRNVFKDHSGVFYREILSDLCSHLEIKVKPQQDIKAVEDQLLIELVRSQQKEFSTEEMNRILAETARGCDLQDALGTGISFDELAARSGNDVRLAYLLACAAPTMASAALPFLARLSATTVLSIVAPRVGAAVMPATTLLAAGSTLSLLSRPAYRVTLPAVLEVIRIRRAILLKGVLKKRRDAGAAQPQPQDEVGA